MTDLAEALREVPYFAGLDAATLQELWEASEIVDLDVGVEIITEGSLSDDMYIVLEGTLDITKKYPHKTVTVAQRGSGEVIGEIAILEKSPRTATVTTTSSSRLLRTPASAVEKLLDDPAVIRKMFHTVTVRLREIEAAVRREEQLASLGRMAAQLMHELNNPAAAVGRTSELLADVQTRLGAATLSLIGIEDVRVFEASDSKPMDPLARADAVDSFSTYLHEMGLEDRYDDLSSSLVDSGLTVRELKELVAGVSADSRSTLIKWIGLRSQADEMLNEISVGASRISELVSVVKSYTFLDQAPLQTISPMDGIQDTLLILKHQLKNVVIEIDMPEDLNSIEAPGRNLNQVWANLIENAVDAMDGTGSIRIVAANEDDSVVISVSDTGSGIDPAVRDRIFDPFFTTKEPGKGTGLGLHTVHNTVIRAGGSIEVDSNENGSTFTLRLPAVGSGDG